jgi:hypothetical protein
LDRTGISLCRRLQVVDLQLLSESEGINDGNELKEMKKSKTILNLTDFNLNLTIGGEDAIKLFIGKVLLFGHQRS